jgi:hypothetical protein
MKQDNSGLLMIQQGFNRQDLLRVLLLCLSAFYCTLPLFFHQNLPFVDDMFFHIFNITEFSDSFHDGAIYPRWVLNANYGYGSPTFVFYAPLSYYVVSIIHFLIPSLTTSIIITIWLGFFLSGLAMFVTSKKIFGERGSLLAAVLYQILPFHIADLYIRATFAELFAFIWLPLIFLFLHEMLKPKNNYAALGFSVSYAGLILTHLVSGFMFTFVIMGYIIYKSFLKEKKIILRAFFPLMLGYGLSACYLLPVIFERKYVQMKYLFHIYADYNMNFLFKWEAIQEDLIAFYLPIHIGVVLEILLFLFIVLHAYRNRQHMADRSLKIFFIIIFLSAFFLATPLSRPIWNIIPMFPFLQFPWRWILVTELSLCLFISAIFSGAYRPSFTSSVFLERSIMYVLIVISLLSFVTIAHNLTLSEKYNGKLLENKGFLGATSRTLEYAPVWATDIKRLLLSERFDRASLKSGNVTMDIEEWKSEKRIVNIRALSPSTIRIATFYYPGWKATLNNSNTTIRKEKGSGFMLVDIPQGLHTLELNFVDTPVRHYAKLISLISLFMLIIFLLYKPRGATMMDTARKCE